VNGYISQKECNDGYKLPELGLTAKYNVQSCPTPNRFIKNAKIKVKIELLLESLTVLKTIESF